jgi:hypothetical protein
MTLPGVTAMFSPRLERLEIGHLDLQLAAPALQVFQQVLQALDQIVAAGIERGLEHGGIGVDEVGRGHRIHELAGVELHPAGGLVVQALDLAGQSLHAVGGEQIGLLDEVEYRVFRPLFVREALVAGRRLDDRLGFLAQQPLGGGLPEVESVFPEGDLGLDQFFRILEQLVEEFLKGFADDGRVEQRKLIAALLAFQVFLQHPLALFDDLGKVLGQLVEIGGLGVGGGLRGFWGGLRRGLGHEDYLPEDNDPMKYR